MQYVAALILIFGVIVLCFSAAFAQTSVVVENRDDRKNMQPEKSANITENLGNHENKTEKENTENKLPEVDKKPLEPIAVEEKSENIIMLIISSSDIPVYSELRNLSRLYLNPAIDSSNGQFRYFFVESTAELKDGKSVSLVGDTLIVHGKPESVFSIFFKTREAIRYINDHFKYKMIIRTNLSSFWNIKNLQTLCMRFDYNTFAGHVAADMFVSGTGIFMGKHVATHLTNQKDSDLEFDDVLISEYATKLFFLDKLDSSVVHFMVDDEENKYPADVKQPLYYRVKNQDRTNDVKIFQELLLEIYDIKN